MTLGELSTMIQIWNRFHKTKCRNGNNANVERKAVGKAFREIRRELWRKKRHRRKRQKVENWKKRSRAGSCTSCWFLHWSGWSFLLTIQCTAWSLKILKAAWESWEARGQIRFSSISRCSSVPVLPWRQSRTRSSSVWRAWSSDSRFRLSSHSYWTRYREADRDESSRPSPTHRTLCQT